MQQMVAESLLETEITPLLAKPSVDKTLIEYPLDQQEALQT